jgi:hypothetical protein
MRKRIFVHFLSKRFRTWQLFTERQRATDTTASLMSSMQAQQAQMTAAERQKAEDQSRAQEQQREELLRSERALAEAAARERAEAAEQNLRALLEQQKASGTEELEQRILAITQEKDRLVEEERRMSTLERTRLLEERDQIIEAERSKELDLTRQIQSLVDTNDSLSMQSEQKLRVLKLLSSVGDRLDRALKTSFSKWAKFSLACRGREAAQREKKRTVKRMLRILLGVQTDTLRGVMLRAFRVWERASTAERHLASISSSEAEVVAGLRGRVVELQEEMMALTSRQEGAASWVAERALNRELSSANHELQQRFSELQWRLLEVAKVPPAERKQLVNSVLLDREQEVARSRKEVRVLRDQVGVLERYLGLPLTDRPPLSPAGGGGGPATDTSPSQTDHFYSSNSNGNINGRGNNSGYDNAHRSGNNNRNQLEGQEDSPFHDPPSAGQSKFYRQKFQAGSKMTKQDALQVVLGEMQHLKAQNVGLKEDNARKGAEVSCEQCCAVLCCTVL